MKPTDRPGVLLGVDVGNSKTEVAIATPAGETLSVAIGPGASPQSIGPRASWNVIRTLTFRALADAAVPVGVELSAAAYAVAGLDFAYEIEDFRAAAPASVPRRHRFLNDTFAILRSGTAGDGIAVVVGAGMNCVGVFGDRTARQPALGRMSGDWGGGAVLGEEALAAACRSADGRGSRTVLETQVPRHFGLDAPDQVVLAVHRGEIPRHRLTELAATVLGSADAGDRVCIALAHRQADEAAAIVSSVARQLSGAPVDLPIVLGGGILRANYRVLTERLHSIIGDRWPDAAVITPDVRPVIGAVLLAADLDRIEDGTGRTHR